MANKKRSPVLWPIYSIGSAAVLYCLIVLVEIATCPDLRVRAILVDDDFDLTLPGIVIRQLPGAIVRGGESPEIGDRLVRLGETSVDCFLDFTRGLWRLRTAATPPGGELAEGREPSEPGLPSLVSQGANRWVEIEFVKQSSGQRTVCRMLVQSLPLSEVLSTYVWFLCQLGILAVGALAVWQRPFDASARLFYLMCAVTACAYVGAYHWWVLAGSSWLTIPFVFCASFVPVVTLHFFLEYPRPARWFEPLARWQRALLYLPPLVAAAYFLAIQVSIWQQEWLGRPETGQAMRAWLGWQRMAIYAYVNVAAVYFLGTLVALIQSVISTRNPIEKQQVTWILRAALLAACLIAYALFLARTARVEFALGGGRVPMFCASLLFMLAYAIGISRYKLMLVDQVLSRGMWYYVLTSAATVFTAMGVAGTSLAAMFWNAHLTRVQTWLVAAVLVVVVAMFMWLREQWQRLVDRRFFREKYQLDKALQRMNQAVGGLSDVPALAERLLATCREVLQSETAALYLKDRRSGELVLAAYTGAGAQPRASLGPAENVFALFQDETLLIKSAVGDRRGESGRQELMREFAAELIHALDIEAGRAGLVMLGTKAGSALYTAEDLTFLAALCQITGVALHCARVHRDLSRLHEDLQSKVDRIAQQRQHIVMLQAELNASRPVAAAHETATTEFRRPLIRGSSPALERVLETVRKVAPSETSVLLRGESGTGKELIARTIHENSLRRTGPLISVHCASLAPSLLESELFGHVRGAFTGATSDKRGRFELADGGTIFLDEIGDISLDTQIKLLRVLQERAFERVGSQETLQVNVRVVAATHQNLERLIAEGRFREDLYYRLNVISLTLPPLRERSEDVIELATFFLKRAAERSSKGITHFDEDALEALMCHRWPGNIRQLENAIERAVVLADGPSILRSDLPQDVQLGSSPEALPATSIASPGRPTAATSASREEAELRAALAASNGNKAEAARRLGLPRSTFFSKLKKYGLDRSPAQRLHP